MLALFAGACYSKSVSRLYKRMKHYITGALIALPLIIYMVWHAVQVDRDFNKYQLCNALNDTYRATQDCYSDQ